MTSIDLQADLYSIILAAEYLERAYIRGSVSAEELTNKINTHK